MTHVRLAFCLAHARRKFVNVIKLTGSPEALEAGRLAEIYRIEASIRCATAPKADQDGTDHDGAQDQIDTAERRRLAQVRPGKAVAYALAHWSGLTAFLDERPDRGRL